VNNKTLHAVMGAIGCSLISIFLVAGCSESGGPSVASFINYTWQTQSSGVNQNLNAVWGTSSNSVLAVGDDGVILRFNGSSWQPMQSGTSATLNDIWGSAPNDVFAVGNSGVILHYDGSTWEAQESGTVVTLQSVFGTSGSDVYVVGSRHVLRYNGSDWSTMDEAPYALYNDVYADLETPHHGIEGRFKSIFAVDLTGSFHHYDGRNWNERFLNGGKPLYGVWADNGASVVGVGNRGLFIYWNGTSSTKIPCGTVSTFLDVCGTSRFNILAVGSEGTIARFDGKQCRLMSSPTTNHLTGITGFSDGRAVAVGYFGTILTYGL